MPTFTNLLNLPAPMARALSADTYRRGSADYTVTQLIKAPRQVQLAKRHHETIEVDVSERVYSLLGSSVHSVLELAEGENDLVEKRLSLKINGREISGMTDLVELDTGVLSDFKVCSVFAFLLGTKDAWTQQLNLNAMLVRNVGFDINKVQIVAILRDWMKSRSAVEKDYPASAVHCVAVPLWDFNSQKSFAAERLALHVEAEMLSDEDLPICSPEERWYRGEAHAVYKEGNKKATRVFETAGDAEACASQLKTENPKDNYRVDFRPGQSTMCLHYCDVAHACAFGRKAREDAGLYVAKAPKPFIIEGQVTNLPEVEEAPKPTKKVTKKATK